MMDRGVWSQYKAFFKSHWPHALLLIPMSFVVTATHEAAHAFAVWVQGGTVTTFVWLPSAGRWGYISSVFPEGHNYSACAVSVAPYILWGLIAAVAVLLSVRKRPYPNWAAGTIFIWLYVVPLGDIGNTAVGWLRGRNNDFSQAFGRPGPLGWLCVSTVVLLAVVVGFPLQKRLYRDRALSVGAYGGLSCATLVLLVSFVCGWIIA